MKRDMMRAARSAPTRRANRLRLIAWGGAGMLLSLPLLAMQVTDEVNWTVGDFFFAGLLLFGSLGAYELVSSRSQDLAYRGGVALAIFAAFLLIWSNAAVGITDSAADVLYLGVVAVAIVGAVVARFRPAGMVRAALAAAAMQASVGVVALLAGIIPAHNSAGLILGVSAFFTAMWLAAAWLFQRAVDQPGPRA